MNKSQTLQDQHGRVMKKLRVSLLDNCQFRCLYCMPESPDFLPRKDWCEPAQIFNICKNLVTLGIDEIRLTGGEPTLRPDLSEILKLLSQLQLKKFGITTNAEKLMKYLPDLHQYGCHHINISLDSLNKNKFLNITQTQKRNPLAFEQVMEAIDFALTLKIKPKINMVVMKGVNDDEIIDFIKFAGNKGIEVRFLELMKIGVANHNYNKWFISAHNIMKDYIYKNNLKLTKIPVSKDSTSFNFKVEPYNARVGFIASESQPFCGNCSRLRLTPKGVLRACLMKNEGISVRDLEAFDYPLILSKILKMKPMERVENIQQPMYQIGG